MEEEVTFFMCGKPDEKAPYRSPEEQQLLNEMHDRYVKLKHLGWKEAIYCPKDGSVFLAIEAASTGVHRCVYQGEWPKGSWWILDAGDMWPSHPILWKPAPDKD